LLCNGPAWQFVEKLLRAPRRDVFQQAAKGRLLCFRAWGSCQRCFGSAVLRIARQQGGMTCHDATKLANQAYHPVHDLARLVA
jgi:hypothetical protein